LFERLKRSEDFDKVFRKGKKSYGKHLMMLFIPSKETKIGFSVSKKNGKAVVRNRIKRLLRAAIRETYPLIKGKYYIVILPRVEDFYGLEGFSSDLKKIIVKEKL